MLLNLSSFFGRIAGLLGVDIHQASHHVPDIFFVPCNEGIRRSSLGRTRSHCLFFIFFDMRGAPTIPTFFYSTTCSNNNLRGGGSDACNDHCL
jgi:hypothetical protein